MITITEKITNENYHLLFSAAEAARTSYNEIIFVDGCVDLYSSSITYIPDYIAINGSIDLHLCKELSLPNNISINNNLYLYGWEPIVLPENLDIMGYICVSNNSSSIAAPSGDNLGRVEEFQRLNPAFSHQII